MLTLLCPPRIAMAALAGVLLLAACGDDAGNGQGVQVVPGTSTPPITSTPAEPTPTATIEPTPTPTPPPDLRPVRCNGLDEVALELRLDRLAADIEATMVGYNGEWGFGMVDLDCDVEVTVRPEYVQYTASAGKIVPVIAALRAIEDGELTLEAIEPHLLLVMEHSLDADANVINAMVTPEQVEEVLLLSEVSELTRFEHDWRQAFMPALDLARVWAALLDGALLGDEMTEYLLDLASAPAIPEGLETFPLDPGLPEFQIGQKAGYYVYDGIPYYLLGAGYLRPVEGTAEEVGDDASDAAGAHQGVAVVFALRSLNPDLFDPQRRTVFPLLAEYLDGQ